MDIEAFRLYCLSKPEVTESLPFDENTLVFKVAGKMFALTSLTSASFTVNLKCNPDLSLYLRDVYDGTVLPGYHMNKKHWNTVHFDDFTLKQKELLALVDHSYALVVKGLTKKVREAKFADYATEHKVEDYWQW